MTRQIAFEIRTPLSHRDDLKFIHGIGPGIEKRLNDAGILSYGQLASMTPAEVFSSIGEMIGLTMKRIEDQNWIDQAKKLQPEKQSGPTNGKNGRQHYATFAVEFLLDDGNSVRRTRIVYIQGDTEKTWAGWDAQRFIDTIYQDAGLNIPVSEEFASQDELIPEKLEDIVFPVEIIGTPRLHETSITTLGSDHSKRIQAADHPLEINLSLDQEGMTIPENSIVAYTAIVDAKELRTHARMILGENKGIFKQGEKWNLTVKCPGLKKGTYRIKTDLSLSLTADGMSHIRSINENFDGGLLQVY